MAGIILMFFGGNFFTICAAVEAYRLAGAAQWTLLATSFDAWRPSLLEV